MRNYRQWINWRLEDRGEKKPAKVPVDFTTGERIDPHDSSRWLPYELAAAFDAQHVGFVLTPSDPYFCIDVDHSLIDGQWSPVALDTFARFPGAYMEISYSGDGAHVMARGVPPAGYSTRGPGVELYAHSRFIAITGSGAIGSPDVECGAQLAGWCAQYVKPLATDIALPGMVWTTGPCEGATPIPDDTVLIQKMLHARPSAGVAFGAKASAADLWAANITALADAWPSPTDDYDRSAADAALAAHLAFWTGRDCARIERLMRMSQLVRPKWEREDYLRRTIAGAAARTQRIYTGPQQTVLPPATQGGTLAEGGGSAVRAGYQYLPADAQHEYFAGCVYVMSAHKILMPNGMLLKPEQFNAIMGGYQFEMSAGGKPEKKAFTVLTESQVTTFPKAHAMCFRPECVPGALIDEGGLRLVNSYVPAVVEMGNGDVSPFLDLMSKLFPDERDKAIMLSYMAAMRQYPGTKFFWCPLVQGVEGNGKSALGSILEYAVGERYTHRPNAKELGDSGAKFTGWLDRKLLIVIEEIYVTDRREILDSLKPLITDKRVEIQHKGADQVTGDNRANFFLTSNHKDAVLKTANDRRYAIFYTPQQTREDLALWGMSGEYMPRFYGWLRNDGFADVAGWLQRYPIPDEYNPATHCHRAPVTTSTADAIRESRGYIEQEIMAACDEGRPGFAGGWVSSVALTGLLMEIKRTVSPAKRGGLMKSLGYIPHPFAKNGQVSKPILQEGMKRPVLYVLEGSQMHRELLSEPDVLHNYIRAQGWFM